MYYMYCITWWQILQLCVYRFILCYFYDTNHVDAEFYLTKPRLQNNLVWCGQGLRASDKGTVRAPSLKKTKRGEEQLFDMQFCTYANLCASAEGSTGFLQEIQGFSMGNMGFFHREIAVSVILLANKVLMHSALLIYDNGTDDCCMMGQSVQQPRITSRPSEKTSACLHAPGPTHLAPEGNVRRCSDWFNLSSAQNTPM